MQGTPSAICHLVCINNARQIKTPECCLAVDISMAAGGGGVLPGRGLPASTTESPLCRCRGVAEQRASYLGTPASLPEALGDLDSQLSFWSLRLAGVTQRRAVPVALCTKEGSGRPSTETSPGKEEDSRRQSYEYIRKLFFFQ
ncbi:jg10195 [Pararge aegeria aegeria]|uniref:Jg10195 protein n=1 Tax=Pararge aegeria aegeria TaxID=348720 RepID=A0A8S4QMJ6_9NEOP|nr:jg10195 [Pararge aegeria aegeria]